MAGLLGWVVGGGWWVVGGGRTVRVVVGGGQTVRVGWWVIEHAFVYLFVCLFCMVYLHGMTQGSKDGWWPDC